jgi:hypothetical protein
MQIVNEMWLELGNKSYLFDLEINTKSAQKKLCRKLQLLCTTGSVAL